MKIVLGLLILFVVVISHELGHMIVAKINHIEVKEFWIGFGPKLFGFEKGGTKYSLRLIPLGGACVFDGAVQDEDDSPAEPKNEDAHEGDSVSGDEKNKRLYAFTEAPVWARIATLFAGAFFNFLLAFIMGIVVMSFTYFPTTQVTEVVADSPAQEAGISAGDTIIKINRSRVFLYPEVSTAIQMGIGRPLEVVYEHEGQRIKTDIVPQFSEENGYYMIGVTFGGYDDVTKTPLTVVRDSLYYVRYMIKMTYSSLEMLLTGRASVSDMSGPVGVVEVVGDEYEAAKEVSMLAVVVSMLNIAVLISANLGVINLLPFPALDGGRLLFALYEAITGKAIDPKKEGMVHFVGSLLLIILMIVIVVNDVIKIVG